MMKFAWQAALILLLNAAAATAYSQGKQIYTWTDENGVVHFVDTPPENPDAREVQVNAPTPSSSPPSYDNTAPGMDSETPAEEAAMSYADQKREELAKKRAEYQATQAENATICNQAKSQLERLEPNRRVYFTNEEGETERMDDVERTNMVAELKKQVEEYCTQD